MVHVKSQVSNMTLILALDIAYVIYFIISLVLDMYTCTHVFYYLGVAIYYVYL